MWIRTQNKQRIINSDQVIDIFVDKSGTKIMAETTRDGDFFTLGEFQNRDICIDVIAHILVVISKDIPMTIIPFNGDVDEWCKLVENTAWD